MSNIEVCIDYLKRALHLGISSKYARRAIDALKSGDLVLARQEACSGHFVAGHDGDNSFLPVRVWLDDILAPLDKGTALTYGRPTTAQLAAIASAAPLTPDQLDRLVKRGEK